MTADESDIRESLIKTLEFLASDKMQIEFANKVFYKTYHDEFACWWFDTFLPEDQSIINMFTQNQISELKEFSSVFGACLSALNDSDLPMEKLLEDPQWQAVIVGAKKALASVQNAT